MKVIPLEGIKALRGNLRLPSTPTSNDHGNDLWNVTLFLLKINSKNKSHCAFRDSLEACLNSRCCAIMNF